MCNEIKACKSYTSQATLLILNQYMLGGLKQIKFDSIQLEFDALFINPLHFKISKFFKVCAKIRIYEISDIKFILKKSRKVENLKNSTTKSLTQGFWHSCHSEKLILAWSIYWSPPPPSPQANLSAILFFAPPGRKSARISPAPWYTTNTF